MAILSAILVIVCQTKLICELEPGFDGSNPYVKFLEEILLKMNKLERPQQGMSGHFVGHLGYSLSDKTHIQT